jgi:hypothetical protein
VAHVTTTPARALQVNELPARIVASLRAHGADVGFRYALKTAFKPNATIPIVWAVLSTDMLLLCTTHAKRGIWQKYGRQALNSVCLTDNRKSLQVISADLDTPDLLLPLPEGAPGTWIDEFMFNYQRVFEDGKT